MFLNRRWERGRFHHVSNQRIHIPSSKMTDGVRGLLLTAYFWEFSHGNWNNIIINYSLFCGQQLKRYSDIIFFQSTAQYSSFWCHKILSGKIWNWLCYVFIRH